MLANVRTPWKSVAEEAILKLKVCGQQQQLLQTGASSSAISAEPAPSQAGWSACRNKQSQAPLTDFFGTAVPGASHSNLRPHAATPTFSAAVSADILCLDSEDDDLEMDKDSTPSTVPKPTVSLAQRKAAVFGQPHRN